MLLLMVVDTFAQNMVHNVQPPDFLSAFHCSFFSTIFFLCSEYLLVLLNILLSEIES